MYDHVSIKILVETESTGEFEILEADGNFLLKLDFFEKKLLHYKLYAFKDSISRY